MNKCCYCIPLRFGILIYAYVSLVIYGVIFVCGGAIGAFFFVKQGSNRRTVVIPESEGAKELSDVPFIEIKTISNYFGRQHKRKVYDISKVIGVNKGDGLSSFIRPLWRSPILNKKRSFYKPYFRDDWRKEAVKRRLKKDMKLGIWISGFGAMPVSMFILTSQFFLLHGIHTGNPSYIAVYIVLKCVILTVLFLGATAAGYFVGAPILATLPFLIFEVYMLFTAYAYLMQIKA